LRILHVSDDPLPDARVEKMAYLSRKRNWRTFFAGPGFNRFALGENVFDKLFFVPWNRYIRLGFQPHLGQVRRKLKEIIDGTKPDLIHAHDLFAARVICDSGYPFVFDDHELVSLQKKSDIEWECSDLSDRTAGRYEMWKWSRWERELSHKAPVITVSDGIAQFYAKLGAKVFIVPNYPSEYELSRAHFRRKKDEKFAVVYLGNDISSSSKPFRDARGIVDIFEELGIRFVVIGDARLPSKGVVVSKNYVPHLELYEIMSTYHVGLIPWNKHWFHRYANPNKPYMYAHSGMVVVATSSLQNVIQAFKGKVRTIEGHSDLRETLLELSQDVDEVLKEGKDNKRLAGRFFIFERYEKEMMEAYKNAS